MIEDFVDFSIEFHKTKDLPFERRDKLVEEFNASQEGIEVVEQNQGDYSTLQQSIMASGV